MAVHSLVMPYKQLLSEVSSKVQLAVTASLKFYLMQTHSYFNACVSIQSTSLDALKLMHVRT